MQIEEAMEMFALQLEADGRGRDTIGQCRRHVRVLARWHAGEIETRRLQQKRRGRGLSPSLPQHGDEALEQIRIEHLHLLTFGDLAVTPRSERAQMRRHVRGGLGCSSISIVPASLPGL